MGRGLSDLQKDILRLAYRNRVRERLPDPTYEVVTETTVTRFVDVAKEEIPPPPVEHDDESPLFEHWRRRSGDQFPEEWRFYYLWTTANERFAERLVALGGGYGRGLTDHTLGWRELVEADLIRVQTARALSRIDADALVARLTADGFPSTTGRESHPPHYRVLVFDRPEEKDLRALVPEAFPDDFPEGLWWGGCLTVGRFTTEAEAKTVANELQQRGVQANDPGFLFHPHWPNWDLEFVEAMAVLFDIPWHVAPPNPPPGFPNAVTARLWGYRRLSKSGAGVPRYTAAAVSVSRAFDRLERRGLVDKLGYWHGNQWRDGWVALTDDGITLARELSANQGSNHRLVSRYAKEAA
jgi:hypothetical protein